MNYIMGGNKLMVIANYVEIMNFMREEKNAEDLDWTYKAFM